MKRKDSETPKLTPDEIKDRAASAIKKLQGSKFIVAALTDEDSGKAIIHKECSHHQMALMIKGMLMMNKMLLLDVMAFCAQSVEQDNKKNQGMILN